MMPVRDDLYVKEVSLEGEGRYIVCFNPEEQKREFKKRLYFKQHILKKIEKSHTKEWIIKNGYKKYVDFDGDITLNEERLWNENQFDGKWVLLTNTDLPSKECALYYKGLWQIEASFRDLKQDLETSPIYHHKQRRIIAHIFISFLSLLLKITLKKRLEKIDPKISYREVFEAIRRIKAVKLTEGRQEIVFRTEFPNQAHLAFKATGVAPPPRILSYRKEKPLYRDQNIVSRQG